LPVIAEGVLISVLKVYHVLKELESVYAVLPIT
jgi:hypothetical protein